MSINKLVLPVCLLLDDVSRSKLTIKLAELVQYDVNIVRSIRDVPDSQLKRKIVILEDFLRGENCYSDLLLYKSVLGLEYIYIGLDPVLLEIMKPVADCHSMDPTMINYERLYGIVYQDQAVRSKYLSPADKNEAHKIATEILEEGSVDLKIKRLAEGYLAMEDITSNQSEELQSKSSALSQAQIQLQQTTAHNNMLHSNYLDLIGKAANLNSSLKQYEVILAKDVYDKIDVTRYNTRPNIIYLKEYEELNNMDLLLETLVNMFKYQHRMSVKVLMLFDSSHSKRVMTLPKNYATVTNKFYRRTLLSNDYIAKVGAYKEILETFLINETNLHVLIVVDCKSHLDTVLSGMFLMLPMCRRESSLEIFGLDPKATIVNDAPNNRLSWDNYSAIDSMQSDADKFLYLSSRTLIQDIYKSCMTFN